MGRNRRSHRLSEHFSNKDFQCKCGDCKHALRVSLGLVGGLELLRSKLSQRVNIQKGFVCPEAAEKTNEKKRTFHTSGLAACVSVNQKTGKEVFLAAETIDEFKGIGWHIENDTVHVDVRKEDERETWVIDKGRKVILDDENRASYFG